MSVIDNHLSNQGTNHHEPTIVGTEPAAFVAPAVETVASCIERGRAEARRSTTTLSQGTCVDVLLDCHNAAVRATVRAMTAEAIAEISQVNLVRSSRFSELLDLIHMALAVDAAFDHLDLGA